MVDFKKLTAANPKPAFIHPREIFNALPRPQGINDLYASQAEVLDTWFDRREERDIVIKLHTGGGKTLVALLMAQSIMNETGDPVLYLTPTKQLVEQVVEHSNRYGISSHPYRSGEPFPASFLDGNSVLVGVYQSLFNGFSKFGIQSSSQETVKLGAIILDDSHVALSSVRDAFTLDISSEKHESIYRELADRFRPAFVSVQRDGLFNDIVSGKDFGVVEVPVQVWNEQIQATKQYLATRVDSINSFVWPFLRDNLGVCHCLFGRRSVSITPLFPLVNMLPSFELCSKRIYMSATIADDSEIIRTFDAAPDAIASPITTESLAGVGERMILVPNVMNLGSTSSDDLPKDIAVRTAESKLGVVILSPSRSAANRWEEIAKCPSDSAEVASLVTAMQHREISGPAVLANRYDGIDLADDACRLLIMDDLPQGTSNYDIFRTNVVADASVNSLLAQRIEQGIGRGTRGGGDFCVILMVGSGLVGWIFQKKNLAFLTASTRVQLRMGQKVSAEVNSEEEILETIEKCLERDPDWVSYHASELTEAVHTIPVDESTLKIASIERRVFRFQLLRDYAKALATLENTMKDTNESKNTQGYAWLAASAARIAYQNNDPIKGQALQTTAYSLNSNHIPPETLPAYKAGDYPGEQSQNIVDQLQQYDQPAAILSKFDGAISNLIPEASAFAFEKALQNLGSFLGFVAERPESVYGVGPDVLWRTCDSFDFVIEAKNRKKPENPLSKKDHGQLLESEKWFKKEYPKRKAVRVSALPEAFAENKVTPDGTFALKLTDITNICIGLRRVLERLVQPGSVPISIHEECEKLIQRENLTPALIKKSFLNPFVKEYKRKE